MRTSLKKSCVRYGVIAAFALCSTTGYAQDQENEENILVGRIAHIEGQLLRHMPEEDDWVLTDVDTPFGAYDNVFSSEDGKAEIIMPNNTLVRIGGDTQLQLVELTDAVTELDISSGTARLYNNSSSTEIRTATPFGEVIMPPETVCDLFVHEAQAELASLNGTVEFIHAGSTTRHAVIAGSSIIATPEKIVASAHTTPTAWDSWNAARDAHRAQRMQARGESTKYLPESLRDQAHDLDNNGRWEQVDYEGAPRYFWRPSYVSAGWTPFSSGRWIVWHGDHTWVPCEPFGYVTHHYGNWVYIGNCWYWAPPVSRVMASAGLQLLHVGVGWYPGRVAWVSSGISIGWFPLAPYEIYYCRNYWGPWCRVRHHHHHHYYDCRTYRHHRHARFIERSHFHRAKDYRYAGLRTGRHGEKYRGTSLVPEKVRRDFKNSNQHRFASNMPGFREKVKKIDARRDKRGGQVAGNRFNTNPFKRESAKGFENNRRSGTTKVENTSRKFAGDTQRVRKQLEPANKNSTRDRREKTGAITGADTPDTRMRHERAATARRSAHQPSGNKALSREKSPARFNKPAERSFNKTADIRRTLQASVARTRPSAGRQFEAAGQGRTGGNYSAGRSTVSGRASVAGRSGNAAAASRAANRGAGSAAVRSQSQQRSQMNSAGSMGYSAGGRR